VFTIKNNRWGEMFTVKNNRYWRGVYYQEQPLLARGLLSRTTSNLLSGDPK
jgi:hypothetical protein